jgi:putative hydrolase of the HAD superfamily
MQLIFDLDDTLYPERTYVESGLRAVAASLQHQMGWDADASYRHMLRTLEQEGRGAIFDRLLEKQRCYSRAMVKGCVDVYRHHRPSLTLYPEAAALLRQLQGPLYLVTDGHKLVQQRKVEALQIAPRFEKMYLTHRFGVHRAKPSTYCFEHIQRRVRCEWRDMVYVGDNPAKDFVNLNRLGARTVRVLTGHHKDVRAQAGYDAQHTISNLAELPTILAGITP